MAAHRYWRVKTISAPGAYISWATVYFCTVANGASVATGGTAIADSYYAPEGDTPANAYDATSATFWACNGSGTLSWIGYDWGTNSANWPDIVEILLQVRNDGSWGQYASVVAIEYSDNGTTWTELYRTGTITWAGAGNFQRFTYSPPATGIIYAKEELHAWMDASTGITYAKEELGAWCDAPNGVNYSKEEVSAWLDTTDVRFSKTDLYVWLDALPVASGHRRMSLM